MESDGLEADEVVAGGNRLGDRRGPRRVVGNHLASGPLAIVDGAGEQTSLVDLEPLEGGCVNSGAGRARARREVGELKTLS